MSKPRKNKLRRQRKEREAAAAEAKRLFRYLEDYGAGEGVQDPSQAEFDSQIKGLAVPLAIAISETDHGTIIDIGCGRGILLNRINGISDFKDKKDWSYYGTDYDEHKGEIINFAYDEGINRRVDFVLLSEFYKGWPEGADTRRPHIAVIRNVMHELNIDNTVQLIHHLSTNLTRDDTLYIQDLQVFPRAERGNVCWHPKFLEACLVNAGFTTFSVEEPSRTGNRWFIIGAKRTDAASPTLDELKDMVIAQRVQQWQEWQALGALHEDDERFRDVKMAKIDFDLQFGSLSIQLQEAHAEGVAQLTGNQEVLLLKEIFSKQLNAFDFETFGQKKTIINKLNYFRDRANNQDSLERFLRDPSAVVVICGGPLTGKSSLVKEVLSRRALERNAVFLDIPLNSSVWNIIDDLLSKLGCRVSDDIAKGFSDIRFADISDQLKEFIYRVATGIVFVLEGFERLVDPNGVITDPEVRELVKFLAQAPSAKLIITSRRFDIDLSFIDAGQITSVEQPPIGRFPRGNHVVNVLDDFVDRSQYGIDEYPEELLEAIDRHPFLTHLAALIIRREGKGCLSDEKLLDQLKGNLRSELLERVVDDTTRAAVEMMSLLRVSAPQSLIEALAGRESVEAATRAGLVYAVRDRSRSDLLSVIGVLRVNTPEGEPGDGSAESKTTSLDETHRLIAAEYERLYRQDDDPRWLRELHYHTLLVGDSSEISGFGTKYKTEIFWAGDYLFRGRKFETALWAFKTAHDLSLKNHHTEMRLAACLMRTGSVDEGKKRYEKLIEKYPQLLGIKTSFIDSLLYVRDFPKALNRLSAYELRPASGHWVAGQFGRAHLGLHEYPDAIKAFEIQFNLHREPFVYRSLARAYRRIGEAEREFDLLVRGAKEFEDSSPLKRDYAACLERRGSTENLLEAEQILEGLYNHSPRNGLILLPYCKVLCRLNKVDLAEQRFGEARGYIFPENFERPIEIEILKSQEKWELALELLTDVPASDEHLLGVKMEVYFAWAMSVLDVEERKRIARDGLGVPIATALETNAPLMITSAKLAVAARDLERFKESVQKVKAINPGSMDLVRVLEEARQQYAWEVT